MQGASSEIDEEAFVLLDDTTMKSFLILRFVKQNYWTINKYKYNYHYAFVSQFDFVTHMRNKKNETP